MSISGSQWRLWGGLLALLLFIVGVGSWYMFSARAALDEMSAARKGLTSAREAIEELARVDSSLAITLEAGVSLGAMPIYRFGNEDQKQRHADALDQPVDGGDFGFDAGEGEGLVGQQLGEPAERGRLVAHQFRDLG